MGGEKRLSYEPKAQSCSIFPPILIYNKRNYFEKKLKKEIILNINFKYKYKFIFKYKNV